MIQLNELAWEVLEIALKEDVRLGWEVSHATKGTLVIDAGCHHEGCLAGGLAMAEIGMAGFAKACASMKDLGGFSWPTVEVTSNHPLEACFLSQSAHWSISTQSYQAMGSGPACLLRKDSVIAQEFGWNETGEHAVLILEAKEPPDETVCGLLAQDCGVSERNLAIIVAPTSSLAGVAQIAARSVETALHKMHELGFDLREVVDSMGSCPVAAPTGDNLTSLGKTNDVMMFGSQVWLAVRIKGDIKIAELVETIPASSNSNYGEPFLNLLKIAGGFYNLDPGLFAPAEITITNLNNGQIYHAGKIDNIRLEKSLGI